MEKSSEREIHHTYEENWKQKFSHRLQMLTATRDISLALLAETLECGEDRAQTLLTGGDFPTVPELLRLCFLCYDADEILFGARDAGLFYLLRGKFQ